MKNSKWIFFVALAFAAAVMNGCIALDTGAWARVRASSYPVAVRRAPVFAQQAAPAPVRYIPVAPATSYAQAAQVSYKRTCKGCREEYTAQYAQAYDQRQEFSRNLRQVPVSPPYVYDPQAEIRRNLLQVPRTAPYVYNPELERLRNLRQIPRPYGYYYPY